MTSKPRRLLSLGAGTLWALIVLRIERNQAALLAGRQAPSASLTGTNLAAVSRAQTRAQNFSRVSLSTSDPTTHAARTHGHARRRESVPSLTPEAAAGAVSPSSYAGS